MNIYLSSDHGGVDLKNKITAYLKLKNIKLNDFGTHNTESVDYPNYAEKVCDALKPFYNDQNTTTDSLSLNNIGILFCGSGQGMAIKANKYSHIRAALCWNSDITKLSREHNNANILCLPGRFISYEAAIECVDTFLNTPFAGGRHSSRVNCLK